MRFSDSHHFRRIVAGCCMVAGPLLVLIAFVVSPAVHTKAGPQMAAYALHPDRLLISTLLSFAALVALVGATLGLMHMLRERRMAYGHVGTAFTLVGLLGIAAQFGTLMLAWQMVKDGVQPGDVTAWHGVTHNAAAVIVLGVVGWMAAIGYVVLAAGLYRARVVDWWMAAMLAVGVVAIALATPLASIALGIVGSALMLIGLGSIGTMVLREADADWEHTPDYRGFRPAAGTS